nr:MAG TPA: hypothetical protein [Caudoviricetes sp.]
MKWNGFRISILSCRIDGRTRVSGAFSAVIRHGYMP